MWLHFPLQFTYDPNSADWSREMRGNPLISTVNLEHYMVVFAPKDEPKAHDFCQTLDRVGHPMGIAVGKPNLVCAPDDRTNTILRVIEQNLSDQTQMVSVNM